MDYDAKRQEAWEMADIARKILEIPIPVTLPILIQKLNEAGIVCVPDETLRVDAITETISNGENFFRIFYNPKREEKHILFCIAAEFGKIVFWDELDAFLQMRIAKK